MLAIALDSSQIVQYLFCPHSWYLRYKEHLFKPVSYQESIDRGSKLHSYLELYYKLTVNNFSSNYAGCAKEVVNTLFDNSDLDKFISNRFLQYCMYYNMTSTKDFIPIKKENTNAVEIGFSKIIYEDAKFTFIIEGRIDLLAHPAENTSIEMFVDHKTQSRASNLYQYKSQFLTYALATELKYGLINYIGMTKETNPNTFRRQLITFPEWKVLQWKDYIIKNVFFPIGMSLLKYQHFNETDFSDGIKEYIQDQERELFQRKLNSCSGAFDSNPCMFTDLCETKDQKLVKTIKAFNYTITDPWVPWKEEE